MELSERFGKRGRSGGRGRTAQPAEEGPDVLSLLHEDHEKVKGLFTQALDEKSTPAMRGKLSTQIADELTLHAEVEEKIFYPAMKAASKRNSEEREEVLEAYEEHAAVKDAIKRLKRVEPRDETQRAKLQVLQELVEHHVEEEESEMFPEARSTLGEQKLREIGAKVLAAKQRKKGTQSAKRGGGAASGNGRRSTSRGGT